MKRMGWLMLAVGLAAGWFGNGGRAQEPGRTWEAFELAELLQQRVQAQRAYLQFINVPTLQTGLYFVGAGGVDRQEAHPLDEVYYVVSGRATLRVDGAERPVQPGSVIYVKAGTDHRFHSIREDLTVLVFFSAAPSS